MPSADRMLVRFQRLLVLGQSGSGGVLAAVYLARQRSSQSRVLLGDSARQSHRGSLASRVYGVNALRLNPRRASLSGSDTWPVRASTSMADAELPRQEPA